MSRWGTRRTAVLAASSVALLLAGCASQPSSQDAVPLLSRSSIRLVTATCLAEAGSLPSPVLFDVTNDRVVIKPTINAPSQQGDLAVLASCLDRYPVDAEAQFTPTADWLVLAYNYDTQILTPCLEAQGFTIAPPPERGQFVQGFVYWQPYDSVTATSLDEMIRLARACPPKPAYLRVN